MLNKEVDLILDRFEDLKQYNDQKFKEINEKLDLQCINCKTSIKFESRQTFQWWSIGALWSTVGGMIVMFIKHVASK